MTSKERVLRTLEFNYPDKIPVDLWVLPAVRMFYGEDFETLYSKYETDILAVAGPFDHGNNPNYFEVGCLVDEWGSEWHNAQRGIIGEVKKPVLADENSILNYQSPNALFLEQWEQNSKKIDDKIVLGRNKHKFVRGGWVSLFERMQFLRGTEELFCDIAVDDYEFEKISEIVMNFYRIYIEKWLEKDIDAISFGDDWGSQRSLLISPETWRNKFKPMYKELFQLIKAKGKKIFFHSDGYIMDIYEDLIEIGVDAINSQLWCMGVEAIAEKYAGKVVFWGEISRQTTLPYGTPDDIQKCADIMKKALFVNGGGLIGQSEVNSDVSLKNIEAVLKAW